MEANEVFVTIPQEVLEELLTNGFQFYPWEQETTIRLVTAFDTKEADVVAFLEAAQRTTQVTSTVN